MSRRGRKPVDITGYINTYPSLRAASRDFFRRSRKIRQVYGKEVNFYNALRRYVKQGSRRKSKINRVLPVIKRFYRLERKQVKKPVKTSRKEHDSETATPCRYMEQSERLERLRSDFDAWERATRQAMPYFRFPMQAEEMISNVQALIDKLGKLGYLGCRPEDDGFTVPEHSKKPYLHGSFLCQDPIPSRRRTEDDDISEQMGLPPDLIFHDPFFNSDVTIDRYFEYSNSGAEIYSLHNSAWKDHQNIDFPAWSVYYNPARNTTRRVMYFSFSGIFGWIDYDKKED